MLPSIPTGDDRGQARMDLVAVLITIVSAGVVAYIGLFVMSDVIDIAALSSGDPLYNASQSLNDSINSTFSIIGLAFVVVVLSAIIYYLYGLRGGR